jgi:hypothetical protein
MSNFSAGGVAQVIEYLSSKSEAMSSKPSTAKKTFQNIILKQCSAHFPFSLIKFVLLLMNLIIYA